MKPKRARGTGSITPHQGGFWARLPVEGKVRSLGVHPTYEAAEDVLNAALIARAAVPGASATQLTFATFGRRVLDMREDEGVRGITAERRTFKRYFENCAFADRPITEVTSADISDLLRVLSKKQAADTRGTRKVTRDTVRRYRTMLSAIFKVSVERGLRAANPCTGVAVKGTKHEASHDPDEDTEWDWLRGDEQLAFLEHDDIQPWFKALVRVAWGTGLRQGEMWNLEMKDLHMPTPSGACTCGAPRCIRLRERGPHIHVRYGSRGRKPPKNGCVRSTPLFGEGLAGMQAWLEILPTYCKDNPHHLVFPSVRGYRRPLGAPARTSRRDANGKQHQIDILPEALAKIGVTRHIRWHDLRHTCASSLVSGTWGRAWPLLHVRDMLGHKDIKTTQRYSHLDPDEVHKHGAATPGHVTERVMSLPTDLPQAPANTAESVEDGASDIHSSRRVSVMEQNHDVRSIPNTSISRETAQDLMRLVGEGKSKDALKILLSLAAEVLDEEK